MAGLPRVARPARSRHGCPCAEMRCLAWACVKRTDYSAVFKVFSKMPSPSHLRLLLSGTGARKKSWRESVRSVPCHRCHAWHRLAAHGGPFGGVRWQSANELMLSLLVGTGPSLRKIGTCHVESAARFAVASTDLKLLLPSLLAN